MNIKRILITGANGFLGKNLVAEYQDLLPVNCLVRKRSFESQQANVYYFKTYNDDSVAEATSQSDVIVHCASMLHGRKEEMYAANVDFTRILIDLSKKYNIKQFIYISTENIQQKNTDLYTVTKQCAENEVRKFKNHTILRPTVLYGPGDTKYVTRLIKIIIKYPIVPVLGKGKNKFQFLYVEDLIRVIKSSFERKIYGTYVIAGPESITYNDFINALLKHLKISKPVVRIPVFLLKPLSYLLEFILASTPITATQLENLAKDRDYDISDTVNLFDYKPTSLDQGLVNLISQDF